MTFRTYIAPIALLVLVPVGQRPTVPAVTHGSTRGTLILQGGVGLNRVIADAFVASAGGPTSHVVVIPTASVGDAGPPGMSVTLARRMKDSFGVAAFTVVHTIDRAEADSDAFVDPIRHATGVWMLGGFPPNLVHAYLGTKTERAIQELLDRGGVVGGESAGAMIQGSWLDTTDDEWTPEMHIIIGTHASGAGFGLLTNAAIFPHFDKRGPEAAARESAADPGQLAIGIDEETALVVHGDLAEVVGLGTVSMYDGSGPNAPHVVTLRSGDRYSLSARHVVATSPVFRAEAYVITQQVSFHNRDRTVTRGLTAANFQAAINGQPVALDVSEDPKEPGSYVLSINPPIELRDGKAHKIDVKIRNWDRLGDKWRDLPLKWSAVLTKPGSNT